ncbi:MAG: hypothetical protein DWQ02_28830 [Bacteroidetes bacterium]|nr:MAG: hypothetical protein DWQ02_28830 [Bacteroidota bacterium]
MATRLEMYLNGEFGGDKVPVSPTIAIIGTDKEKYSPLLSLYTKLLNDHPNCLSAYLINGGIPWSSLHNFNWLHQMVNIPTLNTFYIAHPAINTALSIASKEGLTLASFNKNYKGNRNDSYAEVTILIFTGFKNFEESTIPIGGGKNAGILRRQNG